MTDTQPADARIEAAAIALWHRFGSPHQMTWDDEGHKAEFRLAAQAAMEAAANVQSDRVQLPCLKFAGDANSR